MIERVHLTNFKSHADTQIELGRLTALIGPNSSGKTSVLQAIRDLDRLVSGSFLFKNRLKYGQNTISVQLAGRTSLGNKNGSEEIKLWDYSVRIDKASESNILKMGKKNKPDQDWDTLEDSDARINRMKVMGGVKYLKVVGASLRIPSYSEQIPPRIDDDGTGLASAVAYLMTYEPESFIPVLTSLKSIVQSVERIRVRPSSIRQSEKEFIRIKDSNVPYENKRSVMGHELVFDMVGAQTLPASSVSEGTLITLCLLTLLWSPKCPNIVLLDDIEQGLHPKAQRELIGQLRKILELRPELQIVITSHSPYIVDELEADEVWLLATDEEGISHAKCLSDHPEAERALEVLTTGEFWSAEGEEWILEHGK